MPFLLHRPGITEPSKLTENDARRVIRTDFPDAEVQNTVWSKLIRGEKVFVHAGQLEWVSDTIV
ncbi:MAG: hypothetical protein O2782_19295 [bacterium]|nr:hypothetical protein [bacterium]